MIDVYMYMYMYDTLQLSMYCLGQWLRASAMDSVCQCNAQPNQCNVSYKMFWLGGMGGGGLKQTRNGRSVKVSMVGSRTSIKHNVIACISYNV